MDRVLFVVPQYSVVVVITVCDKVDSVVEALEAQRADWHLSAGCDNVPEPWELVRVNSVCVCVCVCVTPLTNSVFFHNVCMCVL